MPQPSFSPEAIERKRLAAKRAAFESARPTFARRRQRIMTPEFVLILVGVVGLVLIIGLGV